MRVWRTAAVPCLAMLFALSLSSLVSGAELPADLKVYAARFAKNGVKEWTRDYGASAPTWTAKADPFVYNVSRASIVAVIPRTASKDTMKAISVVATAALGPQAAGANKKAVDGSLRAMVKSLEKQPGTRQQRVIRGTEFSLMQEASETRVFSAALKKK